MKILNNVKSNIMPVEIDDTSSETTVFERRNIKECNVTDPVFNTEEVFYTYDEYQYSIAEWNRILINKLSSEVESLKEQVKKLSEEK